METEIIIKKGKPNYFAMVAAILFLGLGINGFIEQRFESAIVTTALGGIGTIYNILVITTPLLIRKGDSLVVKPKIPLDKRDLLIEEIKKVKVNADKELIIIMQNRTKVRLDLGGYKTTDINKIKAQIISLTD